MTYKEWQKLCTKKRAEQKRIVIRPLRNEKQRLANAKDAESMGKRVIEAKEWLPRILATLGEEHRVSEGSADGLDWADDVMKYGYYPYVPPWYEVSPSRQVKLVTDTIKRDLIEDVRESLVTFTETGFVEVEMTDCSTRGPETAIEECGVFDGVRQEFVEEGDTSFDDDSFGAISDSEDEMSMNGTDELDVPSRMDWEDLIDGCVL